MFFKIGLRILLAVVIVAGLVGLAAYAYQAGVAQGLVQSGKITLPEAGAVPAPYYGFGPYWGHPFGFGFGFLGCLFPLLFFFLIFGLLRSLLFWGRPWGWGHHGWGGPEGKSMWRDRMHEHLNEWHKQAHGEAPKRTEGEGKSE